MLTKNIAAIGAIAALAEQAVAFNSHRHLHREVEQRGVETEVVVVVETVYVNAGNSQPVPTQAAEEPAVQEAAQQAPPPPQTTLVEQVKQVDVAAADPNAIGADANGDVVVPPPVDTNPPPPPADTNSGNGGSKKKAGKKGGNGGKKKGGKSGGNNGGNNGGNTGGAPFAFKRGLAYNDGLLANLFGSGCKRCTWGYNWASRRDELDDQYDFVPMLWGDRPDFTNDWKNNAEESIASGSKALFSFNEPDHVDQANMSPEVAAAKHVEYMNQFAGKALIGAPAVTNSGNPGEGLEWLESFLSACESQGEKCQIDFCNVHWYSEAQYADTLFEHIEKAHELCGGKPVWLTEFAPLGSDEDKSSFMENVIPQLDQIDYLHAYSYFMVSQGELMSSLSDSSVFGKLYAALD